jgi:predicted neuraminidase
MLHVRHSLFALAMALLATPVAGGSSTDELAVRRVFDETVQTGQYKHAASLTELSNGDLYLVYYSGDAEYADRTAVFGSRLKKGTTAWTPPVAIARDPGRPLGNAVVWQAPDEVVWLFYVVRLGKTWSTSRIDARTSRDGAQTWSEPFVLHDAPGMMVRNRPIVLHDGDYLLPVYHETGDDTESVGPESTSRFLRFDARTRRWAETGRIRSRGGNIQPGVVEIAPNHLIAYCRRGGDYKPTTRGWIVRAESRDGGATWTAGEDSSFPNPNAAIEFLRLRNGHLLLIFNDTMSGRTPLTVALSTDGDRSWPHRRNLAEGPGDFSYPTAIEASDGRIHAVFTSDRRRVINHAVFEEDWVTAPDAGSPRPKPEARSPKPGCGTGGFRPVSLEPPCAG